MDTISKKIRFCHDAVCEKILFDLFDELTGVEQNIENLVINIKRVFEKVINFSEFSYSFVIFLHEDLRSDEKLELAYFESSDILKKDFEEYLEELSLKLFDDFGDLPKNIDENEPAVAIPIKSVYSSLGYAVIFFHNSAHTYYAPESPEIMFIFSALRMTACICQEWYNKEKFEHYLMNDPMTSLPNRAFLYESIIYSIQVAEIFETNFAILMVKANGIKHINNSLGIITGDLMLKGIGTLLKKAVTLEGAEHQPLVARLSGGDFVILIQYAAKGNSEEADIEKILPYCKAIIEVAREHIEINSYELHPSFNIGVSIYPYHGETAEVLLRRADTAKGLAKQDGSNTFNIYTSAMEGDSEKVLFLSNNLPIAINEKQFELYYQAQVEISTGQIVGAEALIRWNHPTRGMIFPGDFIPYADESGYSIKLDMLVLDMACNQISKWCGKGYDIEVGVNISPKHFANGLIYNTISKALKKNSVDPSKLKVELLESTLLDDFDITVDVIKRLQALGVAIALDDFGAGYSSLEYVAKLPLDYLKIDRTFAMNLVENPSNVIILETIMTLAEGMKVKTISEGVETSFQYDFLKSIGCDYAQGYLISKPMPVGNFEALLQSNLAGQRDWK